MGLFKKRKRRESCPSERMMMEALEERRLLSAPIVTGPTGRFQWNVGPQTIDFTFDQNTLVADPAVQLTNLTTGADGTNWLTRTSADDTAALDFRVDHTDQSGISHSLDRGNYDLYLNAAQVSNEAGEIMAADDLSSFFFQPGDINHDRTVNDTDLNTMENNVPTFGATYSQGDVNYSGWVGDDEDALIAWYGTTLKPAPDAPNTLTASGGPALIDLDWAAPDDPTGIDYYGIWRSSDGGETFSFLTDTDGPVTSYRDSGLPDGSKFMYQVRAHTPDGGYSLATNKAWALTVLPGPTSAPVVSNIKTHGLTLTWDDNSANEAGFFIVATDPDGAQTMFDAPAHDGTGQQSFDVTGLSPSTAYTFQVQAYTEAQVSAYSPSVSATTADPAIPGTPTNLTATGGLGEVQLNWTPPANNIDLDGYTIERSTDGGATFSISDSIGPDQDQWMDVDVADGTTYVYRVSAFSNETGPSSASSTASAITTLPAPTDLTPTLPGSTAVTLNWTDTTSNETGFEIVQSQDGAPDVVIAVSSSSGSGPVSFRATGLMPLTTYSFTVRAKTDAQTSDETAPITMTTLAAGVPTAPSNLTAQSGRDGHSMTLTWTNNADNPTDVSGFTVQRLNPDTGLWETVGQVPANQTNFTDTSLYSLTDYQYQVIANGQTTGDGGDGEADPDTGTADSAPSDSTTGTTDYGDGVVYEGLPGDGNYQTFDGVSASWSGYDDVNGMQNNTATLQLSNLPEHYGLDISAEIWGMNWSGQGQVKMEAINQTDQATLGFGDGTLLSAYGDHDGTSTTISISGMNYQAGDGWSIVTWGVVVRVLRYRVSVANTAFIIGDTEAVPISAMEDDGVTPASGVSLTAADFDSSIISPDGSVTTGSDGTAIADVEGVGKGASRLRYKPGPTVRPSTGPGAATQPASTQRVIRPKVLVPRFIRVPITTTRPSLVTFVVVNEDDPSQTLDEEEVDMTVDDQNYFDASWKDGVNPNGTTHPGNLTWGGGKCQITIESLGRAGSGDIHVWAKARSDGRPASTTQTATVIVELRR